jgi:hypothetical protein
MITSEDIFSINSEDDFNRVALKVFHFQRQNCDVYKSYCELLQVGNIRHYREIPFLPFEFFKSHTVITSDQPIVKTFKSSGTGGNRSQHHITDISLYEQSFFATFNQLIGDPEDLVILALLPNYVEQGDSSLVYMVDRLIELTKNELSGFLLDEPGQVVDRCKQANENNKRVILFGVSYALLDLAELKIDLRGVTIIETGGMKGRRREMTKSELHTTLKTQLNNPTILSEYGMTELLSQAYTSGGLQFTPPTWMKVLIRDVNDPFTILPDGKSGGINVIDLANINSCSFIATQDLGKTNNDQFEVLGRFDHSEIRGCNLLVQ